MNAPPTYALRARIVYAGMFGETPLVWKTARESRSAGEMAKRVRQLGTPWLLYNLGMVEWVAQRDVSFEWDSRMARLYVDYCRTHLVMHMPPPSCDGRNGGYCVLRIETRPLHPAPGWTFFAPGIEQVYRNAVQLREARRYREAVAGFARVAGLLPDLGQAWNELGAAYGLARDWTRSRASVKSFADRGMVDRNNLLTLGTASLALGFADEASAALTKARATYPDSGDVIDVNLGEALRAQASREIERGRFDAADAILLRARDLLVSTHCEWNGELLKARDRNLATILYMLGDSLRRRGDAAGARALDTEILRLSPDSEAGLRVRKRQSVEIFPAP